MSGRGNLTEGEREEISMVLKFVGLYRIHAARNLIGKRIGMVFWSFLVTCSAANWASMAAEQTPPAAAESAAKHAEDEQTIRAQSMDYAKAFAIGDVAALARMWADDAVFTDESGTVYRGREAIRSQIEDFFKRNG